MTLRDQINSFGAQPSQKTIQESLQAKTGKAGGKSGPAASTVQQDVARDLAASQMGQVRQTGQIATAQQQAREEEARRSLELQREGLDSKIKVQKSALRTAATQHAAKLDAATQDARSRRSASENLQMDRTRANALMKIRELTTSRNITVDNLFQQFEQSQDLLADRRDKAKLEQVAFNLAFADQQYLDNLEEVGRRRRLDNKIDFQNEMASLTLGQELERIMEDLRLKEAFNGGRRQWERALAEISVDHAIKMADAATKHGARVAAWSTAADVAGASTQIAAKNLKSEEQGAGGGGSSGEGYYS